MLNEIYLNMYRVAVTSNRLPIEFIPKPYREVLKRELEEQEVTPTE
ncbi:hypothetical protein [Bacillus thermotolerans]|uniref:Uncharacterized protein n=1 Tax=Bacillus thermotolerans TaxID=1221996 RepID=A0A0F5HYX1_BACTR|nr:hypothetical protein [Bacillus thermotolerans]KKB34652.1 hypothetical protein QY97_02202 [Bacillus thermotolerans]KKB38574.1 hypothetical protein QY95_02572 [Bacillus thermotolerans]